MASVLAHAAIPLLTARRFNLPRRAAIASALLACVADLDVLGYAFDQRNEDLLGHRGLTHSLLFALLLAAATALLFRRKHLGLFLLAALSHPLIDALTFGAPGVALLAPLTDARFLFPLHLVPSLPLGVPETLGRLGVAVLLDELLWLVLPWWLLLQATRTGVIDRRTQLRLTAFAFTWAFFFVSLRHQLPEIFGPPATRVVKLNRGAGTSDDLRIIPTEGLPGGKLVTRLDDLQRLGLFDRRLEPEQRPWSSEFFPSWFGREAGRWRDPHLTLLSRTLNGVTPPSAAETKQLLTRAASGDPQAKAELFNLSPAEKYDLAAGDYELAATRTALLASHNAEPKPRFWDGLCNGVAAASLENPEPFNVVTVLNPDGQPISFHPNDLKALLGLAWFQPVKAQAIGVQCLTAMLDNGRVCSMNPAGYVLTVLNRLGLARRSFLVDVHPSPEIQYYAASAATVTLGERHGQLLDFDSMLELSSTTLPPSAADQPDPSAPGRYQKVGVRTVRFNYSGQLLLGSDGELLGGRWTGDPADGPDCIGFVLGGPQLTSAGALTINPHVSLSAVLTLAHASAADGGTLSAAEVFTESR
ncbi:MAG: metal-dependent hydrolase [Myxococcaceae bacterium]